MEEPTAEGETRPDEFELPEKAGFEAAGEGTWRRVERREGERTEVTELRGQATGEFDGRLWVAQRAIEDPDFTEPHRIAVEDLSLAEALDLAGRLLSIWETDEQARILLSVRRGSGSWQVVGEPSGKTITAGSHVRGALHDMGLWPNAFSK